MRWKSKGKRVIRSKGSVGNRRSPEDFSAQALKNQSGVQPGISVKTQGLAPWKHKGALEEQ